MGYDRGDSFYFDFEPNGISFGSKSKGKLESKGKKNFLSVYSNWNNYSDEAYYFYLEKLIENSQIAFKGIRPY